LLKALAAAAFVVALVSVPAGAIAVNVSSNDGSGTQTVAEWYGCGAYMTGSLKSTKGAPVYYNGAVVYDNDFDAAFGRYTTNTTSTSLVTKKGLLGDNDPTGRCGADGVHMKVCKDVSLGPDPCGTWSATIRR
jgi:hypothetical protein